jgi:hypothetical protein
MKNKMVLGVIVVAIILGAMFFFVLPKEGSSASMDIIFYDADGNEIGTATTTGFSIFGIRRPGVAGDIHSLKVSISYVVTTDIEYNVISTMGWLEVVTTLNTMTGGHVYTLDEHRIGSASSELEGIFEHTYLMDDLLPPDMIESVGKANGWNMKFNGRVKTSVSLGDGEWRYVEDTCGISLTLTWEEQLELESYISLP